MCKVKKSNLLKIFFLQILLLLYLVFLANKYSIATFTLTFVLIILIFLKSRVSFFSIFSFAIFLCLLQSFIKTETGNAIGILNLNIVENQFWDLCNITFYFLFVVYVYLCFSDILLLEKQVYIQKFKYSNVELVSALSIAVLITLLMLPSIPNFQTESTDRYNWGIIPFSGFEIIPFVLIIFALSNIKRNKWTYVVCAFIAFWYISHGERVTTLGFIIYVFLLNYHNNKKHSVFQLIKYIIFLMVVLIIFIWIGLYRSEGGNFTLKYVIERTFMQSTASDVVHTFNCSVKILQNRELKFGVTYLSYICELIPFLSSPYNVAQVIADSYTTVGGSLLFNEPLINFGYLGIIIYPFVIMELLHFFLKQKKTRYWCYVWNIIVITLFRLVWYGFTYPIVAIVWVIPLCLICFKPVQNLEYRAIQNNADSFT